MPVILTCIASFTWYGDEARSFKYHVMDFGNDLSSRQLSGSADVEFAFQTKHAHHSRKADLAKISSGVYDLYKMQPIC